MVFNSVYFIWWFLPVTLIVTFLIDKKYQNAFLFLASIFFYAWGNPATVSVLLFSIVLNYFLVILMDKSTRFRKPLLYVILCLNIGILFHYKYAKFIFGEVQERLLPIGISFYTFQILSYAIEVYKKTAKHLVSFVNMGLYVAFFPKVTQGPIEKYNDFAAQLTDRTITYKKIYEGINRFIIGLGKKVLIANVLGEVADSIFSLSVEQLSTSIAWIGAVCYTVQIYYDFSGYSDMAIGLGNMYGFQFVENFNYPYMASSIKDFWRRWHVSLSNWFRDYIYIPLGGNRKGRFKTCVNTMIVFIITGVWHGANWTFWIWGLWHGIIQIAESNLWGKYLKNHKLLSVLYTDLIVVIGWVFFRTDSIQHAFAFLKEMFVYKSSAPNYTIANFMSIKAVVILTIGIVCSGILPKIYLYFETKIKNTLLIEIGKCVFLLSVFLLSLMSIASGTYNPFIYFKF